jgi:hypothetical protein
MKIKRKNGSNRYTVRIDHLLDGILTVLFINSWLIFGLYTIYDEWTFLNLGKKFLCILLTLCVVLIFIGLFIFIAKPYFIIDFDKEIIKIKKKSFPLKYIIKIEYIKNYPFLDKILVYKCNDVIKFTFNSKSKYLNKEKVDGYPMARKIEEINNKLQEYRKQNNLD